MNVVIFEDNPAHADRITGELQGWAKDAGKIVLVTHYTSPADPSLLSAFDCILLDVKMPGKNGMDYARELRRLGVRIPIVFISDHTEYSLSGYEVDALRFLNKNDAGFPQKLRECMEKVAYEVENNIHLFYTFKSNGVFTSIPMRDVLFFEVYDHELQVHTINGVHLVERGTLSALLHNLPEHFVQSSRSYVINILQVMKLSPTEAVMSSGDRIPITKTFSKQAFTRFLRYH